MTDWSLLIKGNISLIWLQECLKTENKDKKISELLNEYMSKNEYCGLINEGTLMMASYLLFVYPKENELLDSDPPIDLSKITTITLGRKRVDENEKCYFIRRIRNAIAHGNFAVSHDKVEFYDNNKAENNLFKVEMTFRDFGNFINNFMHSMKDKHFNR